MDDIQDEPELCNLNTVDWLREGRIIMDHAACLLTMAILVAVERARSHGEDAKLMGQAVLSRESNRFKDSFLDMFRRRMQATAPEHRAHYTAQDRTLILKFAAEKNWTAKEIADFIVVDPSRTRHWLREWRTNPESTLFAAKKAWNSYDEAVKDLVHRIDSLFPGFEIGARTIAYHILKASIVISPSTVRRYLQQPPPGPVEPPHGSKPDDATAPAEPAPPPAPEPQTPVEPFHLLKPTHVNQVWHTDLTKIRVFWFSFWVIAILDGYSRRLLNLTVSLTTPTAASVFENLKSTIAQYGAPRFVITDHGCQFREAFAKLIRGLNLGIDVVRGPVGRPQFNGKSERMFRTIKFWQRLACCAWPLNAAFIQERLDEFRAWYNTFRVHQGIRGLTPDEAWHGIKRAETVRYFARDKLNPVFTVHRSAHCDDPNLPIFDIRVTSRRKTA